MEGRTPVYNPQGEPIGETWAASDRDAIQAAKMLTHGFEGGAGMDRTIIESYPVASSLDVPDEWPGRVECAHETAGLSVADLRQRASAMIEATVAAVDPRPSSSRKRV